MTPEQQDILEEFCEKLVGNMVDAPLGITETVDKHFWELLADDL